jgi:hypothetical protein
MDASKQREKPKPRRAYTRAAAPGRKTADPLHGERHGVAAAQAQRRQARLRVAVLHGVQQRREHARARRADGVAQRHGAAVHVHAVPVPAQAGAVRQRLHGERLVGLDQVVVADLASLLLHQLLHGLDGREEELPGLHGARGVGGDPGEDREPVRPRVLLAHDDHGGGAVVHGRRVAGGDDGIGHVRGRVLPEGGLEPAQRLHGRVRARALVRIHHRGPLAAGDLHGDDLFLELAGGGGGHGLLVRLHAELVGHLAGDAGLLGRVLRVPAHVHLAERAPQPVADEPVHHGLVAELDAVAVAVDVEGRVGHGFLPARDHHLAVAGADGLRGQHDRLEAAAAHLVDGERADGGRQAGLDDGLPRGRLAHAALHHVPHDDLGHVRRVDAGARDGLADGGGAQLRRGERGQRAQEAADGRAHRADDHRRGPGIPCDIDHLLLKR